MMSTWLVGVVVCWAMSVGTVASPTRGGHRGDESPGGIESDGKSEATMGEPWDDVSVAAGRAVRSSRTLSSTSSACLGLPGVGELWGEQSATEGSVGRGASGRMLCHTFSFCSLSCCRFAPCSLIREASLSEPEVGWPSLSVTITIWRLMIIRSRGCFGSAVAPGLRGGGFSPAGKVRRPVSAIGAEAACRRLARDCAALARLAVRGRCPLF